MRALLIVALVLTSTTRCFAADDLSKDALWITGDVFMKEGLLFFRADKPVQGNTTGDIVLIGPTKDGANVMAPLLMRAAERHVKCRFYGVLMPTTTSLPGQHGKLPSVQFIVWKLHAPTDPDELPAGQAIHPDPSATVPGYTVKIHSEKPK